MGQDFKETAHLRTDKTKYDNGWQRVFGKKEKNIKQQDIRESHKICEENQTVIRFIIPEVFGLSQDTATVLARYLEVDGLLGDSEHKIIETLREDLSSWLNRF